MSGPCERTASTRTAGGVAASGRRALPPLLCALVLAVVGCNAGDDPARTVQPGAPGESGRVLPDGAPGFTEVHTDADVAFMHGMIAHHEQALRMTALVPRRSDREDIARFARRIEIGQQDEITMMAAWLEARGEAATAAHDHAQGALMPGMLTQEQFAQLEAARGTGFDRLFLQLMTYHHEGALMMAADLFDAGGGQGAEIFDIVGHIEADQRIEIDRMRGMLAGLPAPSPTERSR